MSITETNRLALPLLQPAQAQKHVTVNEALMRIDGLTNLVLQSISVGVPPADPEDGECWGVPGGATGAWSGQIGRIAIASNGGWVFVRITRGMQAFVLDRGVRAIHTGTAWSLGAASLGMLGSSMLEGMEEAEIMVSAGETVATGVVIPAGAMVIGAVARVVTAIGGSLSSWKLGTDGAEDRFGSGLGTSTGSWARGMLGQPMTYYQPAELLMTASAGTFSGSGKVRLAVHWLELRLPSA
ncbi:DUF2793 domain-containing protein [Paracoccus sp. TK19116]|uniref:DUF2793 domain-containing protein n=1 Tax=Paracoccus albicereus TaxID=2922394 RepID=A0ABT1MU74_9RHOB|nr:DUF2793 domain-containing protein [Paracoccus albicereus]MCQ0971875.1 DUF2793 domain-containing protein [Paracoccus albicereus]